MTSILILIAKEVTSRTYKKFGINSRKHEKR
jgi:hypothetical protein